VIPLIYNDLLKNPRIVILKNRYLFVDLRNTLIQNMYKLKIVLLLLLFFTGPIFAGEPVHYAEVVIEVQNFTGLKHVPLINEAFSESWGESYVYMSCENSGWVVLRLDESANTSSSHLLEALKTTGIVFTIKEGATATQVSNACNGQVVIY
jgi:hypothetical protein